MPAAATLAKGKGRLSKEQLGQQLRAAALANEGGVGAGAVATSLLQLMSCEHLLDGDGDPRNKQMYLPPMRPQRCALLPGGAASCAPGIHARATIPLAPAFRHSL